MVRFDDEFDGDDVRLLDIVSPRPKEPQEEYAIPFRLRHIENRLAFFERDHEGISVELNDLAKDLDKAEIKIGYIREQIDGKNVRRMHVEEQIREARRQLRLEMEHL
jgi:septal ring factor EnvC (AmiA/AmiB activator)